ncbi:MAG TPA: cell wall-active antibiotics response protein [Clostridiales bacterium]|nr:cell wall-active antibiotics response protein [Clostridiales bacterium]
MDRKKNALNVLIGLVLIAAGVLFACDAIHLIDLNEIGNVFPGWWALFIIIPSIISFINSGIHFGNALAFTIGVLIIVGEQLELILDKNISYGKLVFPVILVFIGLKLVFNTKRFPAVVIPKIGETSGIPNYTAIFGGYERRFEGEKFNGANCTAIFGGVELDLRGAMIENDIVINATAIFGGIDIFLPDNVNVMVTGVPVFGGIENKVRNNQQGRPTVYIKSTIIFAGMDII